MFGARGLPICITRRTSRYSRVRLLSHHVGVRQHGSQRSSLAWRKPTKINHDLSPHINPSKQMTHTHTHTGKKKKRTAETRLTQQSKHYFSLELTTTSAHTQVSGESSHLAESFVMKSVASSQDATPYSRRTYSSLTLDRMAGTKSVGSGSFSARTTPFKTISVSSSPSS